MSLPIYIAIFIIAFIVGLIFGLRGLIAVVVLSLLLIALGLFA